MLLHVVVFTLHVMISLSTMNQLSRISFVWLMLLSVNIDPMTIRTTSAFLVERRSLKPRTQPIIKQAEAPVQISYLLPEGRPSLTDRDNVLLYSSRVDTDEQEVTRESGTTVEKTASSILVDTQKPLSSSDDEENNNINNNKLPSNKNVTRLASLFVFQYYCILKQDELLLNDPDIPDTQKNEPMSRRLAAHKRFGCSPLQYYMLLNNNTTSKVYDGKSIVSAKTTTLESVAEIIEIYRDNNEQHVDTREENIIQNNAMETLALHLGDPALYSVVDNNDDGNAVSTTLDDAVNNNTLEFHVGTPKFHPMIDYFNTTTDTTIPNRYESKGYELTLDRSAKLALFPSNTNIEKDISFNCDGRSGSNQPTISPSNATAPSIFSEVQVNNENSNDWDLEGSNMQIIDTENNRTIVTNASTDIVETDSDTNKIVKHTIDESMTHVVGGVEETGIPDPQQERTSIQKLEQTAAFNDDELIAFFRKKSSKITQAFQIEDFKPAWFSKNADLQTILGVIGRQKNMYFPPAIRKGIDAFRWDKRERFNTSTMDIGKEDDGVNDFFDVDWKFADNLQTVARPSSDVPLVLICHGLQSSSDSPMCKDMALAFNAIGMDVACINFRGCSGEPNLTPMGYHLSFTNDLERFVKHISSKERPNVPIYLSGFSLGANVVTKFLAEQGADAYSKYNICGAAVNAIPFNLTEITANLNEPGFHKSLYGNRLRDSLVERIESTYDEHDHPFTLDELRACETINQFEDLVLPTAYNFTGVHDYLTKSSVGGIVDKVMVPELVIQALDDPFMQGNINPANNPESPFRIQYTEHGGHCGYIFHSKDDNVETESSWLPNQMARFIDHVHKTGDLQKKESNFDEFRSNTEVLATASTSTPSVVRKLTPSNWRSWATSVSQAFQTTEFEPAWFAKNNHFQTIMGTLAREDTMYRRSSYAGWLSLTTKKWNGRLPSFRWDRRERMETPDGDFFDVDFKFLGSSNGNALVWDDRPIVLICHGLESNSKSPLAKDMARAFNNVGMHTACINFRGCSGEPNRTPVAYHLGFIDDLKQTIGYINSKYPNKRIYLSGFSLGANVVTTYLEEMGDKAMVDHNIIGAAVNAVPFDMPNANRNLNEDGLTKSLYGDRLLKSMIRRIEESYDSMDFGFPIEKSRECKTIMDMENLVIAPVFGFKDAWDYYERTSTGSKLDRVAVPQFIIQSRDDPFFKDQINPPNELHQPVRIQYTEHGGHCGYVFHEINDDDNDVETSWMPTELARFLKYVDDTSFAENASNRHRLNKEEQAAIGGAFQ